MFLCLENLRHCEDNFNSTPILRIVPLSRTKCFVGSCHRLIPKNTVKSFRSHRVLNPTYQVLSKGFTKLRIGNGLYTEIYTKTVGDID